MKTFNILSNIAFATILLTTLPSFGAEDFYDFDSIVKQLASKQPEVIAQNTGDPLEKVKIHFGIGFTNSFLSYAHNQGRADGFHKGFQASLGIDLFSPHWIAEGVVRTFGEANIEDTRVSLREFDLKLIHVLNPNSFLSFHAGIGLAARYLNVKYDVQVIADNQPTGTETAGGASQSHLVTQERKYTTPSSILLVGTSARLTDNLGFGAEISYRSALIDDTAERSAMNMTFRLNTNF